MNTPPSIRVANAPCSWGVLEFDLPGEALGYAQVLDEMCDTGFTGTELGDWGFMPAEPKRLREELSLRGLELLGAFVPVAFAQASAHAPGEERAIRTARLMAEVAGTHPFIVLADDNGKDPVRVQCAGRITPDQGLEPAAWEMFSEGVERVAAAVRRETGLRSVFHHHAAGFVETPLEIHELMRRTDAALLGLCFDTGHYRFGGGADVFEGWRQFRDRIWHVHFKDCHPEVHARSRACRWNYFDSLKHGIFCELGTGDVPFPDLLEAMQQSHYDGWIVVEQDVLPGTGAPKEFARRNRDYLRRCGL
ncbi:MAG: TIM barrel protein [Verrucomicrobiota bacterium]